MEKSFYFMAGLPRSGSTLLTAILNQNPDIYASPQTDLLSMIYMLKNTVPQYESYRSGLLHESYNNIIKNAASLFYSNIDKPIIIDKNRSWGTPYNLNIAEMINPNVKIICTVRPILEILSSFILKARQNPGNFIDIEMVNSDFYPLHFRDLDDARCDYLMRPNGEIHREILSLAMSKKEEHKDKFLIIEYKDIVLNPQETLNKCYDFLNIKRYNHDFDNIVEVDTHNDIITTGIPDLHKIKNTLTLSVLEPEKILSSYVIKKYKNTLDFLY